MSAVREQSDILREFGAALAREIGTESLAKFAKETAGISKHDVRAFIAGEKAPDKLTMKKLFHCFPILMAHEHELRHVLEVTKPEKQKKPKSEPKSETRLQIAKRSPPPEQQHLRVVIGEARPALAPRKPRVEVVTQHAQPPEPLKHTPFVEALRKTRSEMLTDLTQTVKKRLGSIEDESFDFTLKNDGKVMMVKLQVEEKDAEDLVDSGCYVTVQERGTSELVVFCKAMTGGNVGDIEGRVRGVLELVGIAKMLHESVRDRRFE